MSIHLCKFTFTHGIFGAVVSEVKIASCPTDQEEFLGAIVAQGSEAQDGLLYTSTRWPPQPAISRFITDLNLTAGPSSPVYTLDTFNVYRYDCH